MMNFLSYFPQLMNGLAITLILMIASVALGFTLSVSMVMGSLTESFILKKIINLLVFFIRGTPLLVQFFLIYYGLGQFENLRQSFLWPLLREPMACAIMALSINTACYTFILLKGAIASVPKNEIAACEAIGMSKWQALRRVILPRALRIALLAYSNEVLMILKGTSLASTITLLDLMGATQHLIAETYDTVTLYLVAGFIYLLLNAIITTIFQLLKKWSQIPGY